MNGSGITYEDVIAANVRNQKNKEIENLKQEVERLNNIIKEVKEYITYARTPRTIYESGYGEGTCVEICMEHLLEILGEGE